MQERQCKSSNLISLSEWIAEGQSELKKGKSYLLRMTRHKKLWRAMIILSWKDMMYKREIHLILKCQSLSMDFLGDLIRYGIQNTEFQVMYICLISFINRKRNRTIILWYFHLFSKNTFKGGFVKKLF